MNQRVYSYLFSDDAKYCNHLFGVLGASKWQILLTLHMFHKVIISTLSSNAFHYSITQSKHYSVLLFNSLVKSELRTSADLEGFFSFKI